LRQINARRRVSPESWTGACGLPAGCAQAAREEYQSMLDVLLLVIGIGFFLAAVAYASACDRL
jgi:hypothetical protein